MAQKRTATARSEAFGLFKDKEMDWVFRRTLEFMIEKTAEIGECLYAARKIDETDGESWINESSVLADRVETLGDESLGSGHIVSARECYMRASNYYRKAEFGISPTHPQFHKIWKKSVDSFRKGALLFQPPIKFLNIQFMFLASLKTKI